MRGDYYFASLHFVPLQTTGAKIFGLPEYISGLALMVLAWTIADAKYHFRLDVAPFNARLITYAVVVAVGAATLLTDVWRAQGWCVIEAAGSPFTPVTWQAILAAVFIGAFICWAAIAFFIPAKFHRGNAVRYVSAMAKATLRGNSLDLAVIADELAAAAHGLVKHATNRDFRRVPLESQPYEPSEVERCANSILSMIGDRRLCRAMVASSPRTALFLFQEIKEQKRFDIEVGTFASNFVGAAIANKDSFIYHETTPWYWSGFLGMTQPVVKAMFADYELVSGVDKLFDVNHQEMGKWDTEHWSVYFKAMQITVADFIAKGNYRERTTINRAIGKLGDVTRYAYRINGIDSQEALSDMASRFGIVTNLVQHALDNLNDRETVMDQRLRGRQKHHVMPSIYSLIAEAIFDLIEHAATVRSPVDSARWIQLNAVWLDVFELDRFDTTAGRIIRADVFRRICTEIHRLETFPNFRGASLLGFCLNVLGLRAWRDKRKKAERHFHSLVLNWARANFRRLYLANPNIAAACLVEGFTYDAENRYIVRTFVGGLARKPRVSYFLVD